MYGVVNIMYIITLDMILFNKTCEPVFHEACFFIHYDNGRSTSVFITFKIEFLQFIVYHNGNIHDFATFMHGQ